MEIKLINSDATLNSFVYIDSINYIPGETITVNFQLHNNELDIRYVLENLAATVTATLLKNDDTNLTKTCTVIASSDRSLWTFSLSAADTQVLASSNATITLDVEGDASDIKIINARGILAKVLSEGDCC